MTINHSIYGGIVQLSGNRVEIEVTNDDIKGESPRALLKAISTDGAVAGGPFVDSRPWLPLDPAVAGSGKAIFNFQEYLDAPTDYNFTHPYGEPIAIKHPLRAFDIKILAGASYLDNDPTHVPPLENTYGKKIELWQAGDGIPIRILKGGLSQDRQAQYNEAATNFYQDFIQGNKFLTHRPNFQHISYMQPIRLWYLLPETAQVTRSLVVEYTTSTGLVNVLSFEITLDPDGLYEFILDPVKLGIPEDAKQFKVYQSAAETVIGDVRTFIIDSTYYENNNFLFFANSLSGIDDLWFTGAVKLLINSAGETGIQPLDRNATTRDRSVVETQSTGSRKWSVFPGNRMSVADMESLQDFIYSKFRWLVWNGRIIPVNLERGEFELTNTMRDMIINDELEFVLVEAHSNNHF